MTEPRPRAASEYHGQQWNADEICDGKRAEDRAQWCVKELGLSLEDAQERVMGEFPNKFVMRWDPDVVCDGQKASARAEWLKENRGMSDHEAQDRVMLEFPSFFGGGCGPDTGIAPAGWKADALCDGKTAQSRAEWLVKETGMARVIAMERVMKEFAPSFGGVAALGAASAMADTLIPVAPADPALLVWADDFGYTGKPDPAKWGYDVGGHGWGNNELQYYTDLEKNAWVSDGTLKIRAVAEDHEGMEYTSARLVTKAKASWKYGRIEVRLKAPVGRGSWAAAWMLPEEYTYGIWPHSGELDIMEHVGLDPGRVHGTVHTGAFNHMKNTQVGKAIEAGITEFHTYGVEWSPEGVDFLYDDGKYHHFAKREGGSEEWPFDQPFHILLNVAVGGGWGGMKGIDKEAFEGEGQIMEVAWVHVYRLK